MEIETICRYKLPVCIVIFNNDGIYRGTDVNRRRLGSGDDRVCQGRTLRQDDRGVRRRGVNATSPDELKRAVNAAMNSGKPTLINAVIDPAAGSESGRIGNLNPQSELRKEVTRASSDTSQVRERKDGKAQESRKAKKKTAAKKPAKKVVNLKAKKPAAKAQRQRSCRGRARQAVRPSGQGARRR